MTVAIKNIIDSYSKMFEGLDRNTKVNLIELLSASLAKENTVKESSFFESFGAFPSNMQSEEIISAIKDAHGFTDKKS